MLDPLRRLPPNVQGALWLVSGGFIFTSTGVMIRLLSEQIESVQTAFFRAIIGLLLLAPYIATGRVKPWKSPRIAGHLLAHLHGHDLDGAGLLCRRHAAVGGRHGHRFLPAALFRRRRCGDREGEGPVAALDGDDRWIHRRARPLVQPGEGSLQWGALVALANAACVAISILLVKRLSDSEAPLMILTQFAIFSTLFLAPPALWVWRWPDLWGWVLAIGIAVSATIGQYFWVQAFKAGEMSAVAPFEYLRLPFAVFMGLADLE